VLFSSHVVAELERVADHLIVLNSGRVAMSGDVDVLLDAHRLLTGPTDQVAVAAAEVAVVHARAAARQTHLLVRPGSASLPPGWQSRPVGLEELVLAYLNEPTATMRPGPTRSGAADQWKVTA
jgi:ABC-2 type transport system ATP-binding protein